MVKVGLIIRHIGSYMQITTAKVAHDHILIKVINIADITKKMGEFGGQNAHSTLNTDCESGV